MGTGGNFFPATGNGAGTGAANVSGDGDGDYTPRPRPAPLPSLVGIKAKHLLAYFNEKLSGPRLNYSTYSKEF